MTAHCIDTLPPEQTSPAAWRGTDLVADRTWMQALDEADVAELEAALQAFLAQPGDAVHRLSQIQSTQFALPRLGLRLANLRTELLHGQGFALLRPDLEALDAFDALANDPSLHLPMRLEAGDLQFVHNQMLLHDRTGFTDFDAPARKRHMLRLWLAAPGARELPPSFAARYGALTVGDRGGVVVPNMRLTVPLQPAGR